MEHVLVILGTFGFCIASAVIPVFHAEAYLVGASLLAPPELRWPLVIAAAVGQMIGKVGMYYAGRGALLIPGERMQRRIQQATQKYREKGQIGSALVFISSASGFPPFYIVSIAAGMLKFPLPPFLVFGLVGRLMRFSVAVFLPQFLKG
jgi:membrane protein YqaA with SNARE-associated domain